LESPDEYLYRYKFHEYLKHILLENLKLYYNSADNQLSPLYMGSVLPVVNWLSIEKPVALKIRIYGQVSNSDIKTITYGG